MNYLKIARFLSVALKSQTFPEFMMEIVFRGKADLGTPEYYKAYIRPIVYGNDKDESMSGVAHERIINHLRMNLYNISWFRDYLDYMLPKEETYDNIGSFDPSLSVSKHSVS